MRVYNPAGQIFGLLVTLAVGAIAWFTFGHKIVDRIRDANSAGGGGGPQAQRIVNEQRFAPIVLQVRKAVGPGARFTGLTLRPDSAEFLLAADGRVAHGLRYRDGQEKLERFDDNAKPGAVSWPLSRLDTRGPERMARAISEREGGDFQLSIGDFERAETGKLIWILRGTIGERGVAWYAAPDGSHVKRYNPASPGLSAGAALSRCILKAQNDVAKVQRCVARFKP
jgi:hypothetical protein